jgi:hypothetical protein
MTLLAGKLPARQRIPSGPYSVFLSAFIGIYQRPLLVAAPPRRILCVLGGEKV